MILAVAGKDRKALGSLGPAETAANAALDRQRFDGEASSTAELFFDDSGTPRRLLAVGTGTSTPAEAAEKLGGNASAKLLTSGDTKAVIDLSGLNYDADSAASTRSPDTARLKPAPPATPLTAVISTASIRANVEIARCKSSAMPLM